MKGFPEYFNIKQDVLNAIKVYPEETKIFLQRCLDERKSWLIGKEEMTVDLKGVEQKIVTGVKMDSKAAGISDATHRVTELKDDRTGVVLEKYQEEYRDDPNCKLFRLGFVVEEAESLIK